MDEYRISKSRDEIIKLVQKKFETETSMTIWQKNPETGERVFKCEAKFASLDPLNGVFTVAIDEETKTNFNPKLETYFLLQVQDFVFKTKGSVSVSSGKGFLAFQIPHDVRLKELRIHPRFYIPSEEKRFVSAKFESRDDNGLSVDVACPIFNISKSGICIIVSKETLSTIKLTEAIELEGLSFFESLGNEARAIVKNARVYTKKGYAKDDYYALGLEFQF